MARIYDEMDAPYASKCNDVTLCSNQKGFFNSWVEELVDNADPQWLNKLVKAEDGRKVTAFKENKEIMDTLTEVLSRIQPLHRSKCSRISNEKRQAAQTALIEGDLVKALSLASQAVLRAPMTGVDEAIDSGVSLALALWVRSEVLLKSCLPEAALEDLKLALKERLPAKIRPQYYWRMGHCYKGAGEMTRAKVSYELAGRLLANNENAKSQLQKDIDSLDFTVSPKRTTVKPDIELTLGPKQNMPSLSKLIKINEEENKGRFAVADSEIKTGDVLLIDSPYAACLHSDYYGSHCLHCFKRLQDLTSTAPVWCPKCSRVAFCSTQCRDTAVSTYHNFECPYLDLFIGSGMSVLSHIALRMVTQAGLDTNLSFYTKHIINKEKTVEGTALNDIEGNAKKTKMRSRKERLNRSQKSLKNFEEKNLKEDFDQVDVKMTVEEKMELKAAQIYSLCTHNALRSGEDHLKRIVMALFLTECLSKGGFFKNCEPDQLLETQNSISEVLLRNLQLLQFNAHEIYETVQAEHTFTGSKPVYIGVGIYPTGALFNHECYPSVARYFNGKDIILRATRPLSTGEMVSENYGPHFMIRGLKERQRSLACRYWFRCECVACRENWPTLKQMTDGVTYLRCPNLTCSWKFRALSQSIPKRCPKCSAVIEKELVKIKVETVDICVEKYQKAAKLMEEENVTKALQIFCMAVDMFHEVGQGPHKETHIAQDSLRSCFATRGNVHIVKKEDKDNNLENTVPSVKRITFSQ